MTVTLDLSIEDARFLRDHLVRYIASVDDELVHTDKRAMQHALAVEVEKLKKLERRLGVLVATQ